MADLFPDSVLDPAIEEQPSEPIVRPGAAEKQQDKTKRQPPFAVILHNDDINGFNFVIATLRKVFHYGRTKAFWLTLKAHLAGKVNVWSGTLEVAELKADQLRSCGADPKMKGALTLMVTIEELPG